MTFSEFLAKAVVPVVRDLVGVAGVGVFLSGLAELSVPAAMMAGGAAAVGACLLWARTG